MNETGTALDPELEPFERRIGSVRLLFIDHDADQARLAAAEVSRAGLEFDYSIVSDQAGFIQAWNERGWSAIIAGEDLSGWSAGDALRLVRSVDVDVPFIIVSNAGDDDAAAAAMYAGANDYVMRNRLARLGAVIEREVREAGTRHERRHLFRELRHNKERYRRTFEKAPIGIATVNAEGRILNVNDRLAAIVGYEPGELMGRRYLDLVLPAEAEEAGLNMATFISCPDPTRSFDRRYVKKDGSVVWAHVTVTVVREAGGEVEQMIALVDDITEERAAREQLARQSQELRTRAIQQSAVADLGKVALSGSTLDFLFRRASEYVCELLEVDMSAVVKVSGDGRYIFVAGHGVPESLSGAESDAGSVSQAELTLRTGAPVISEDIRSDRRFIASPMLVEHGIISAVTLPIVGSGEAWGVLGAYACTLRPITTADVDFLRSVASVLGQAIERSRAEAELHVRATQQQGIAQLGHRAFEAVDESTFEHACVLLQNGLAVESACLLRMRGDALVTVAGESETCPPVRVPLTSDSQSAYAAAQRKPVIVENYQLDPRFADRSDVPAGAVSGISVPLVTPDGVLGVINCFSRGRRAYLHADRHFVESVANTLAEAMRRASATAALVESEERYRSVVEGASEIIFEIDRDGIVTSLNRAFETITGHPIGQWVGRHFSDFVMGMDRETVRSIFDDAIHRARSRHYELSMPVADGGTILLEVSSGPKIINGEVVAVHGFARNITEARMAERERQHLTRNLQLVLESTVEGIFFLDLQGRCTLLNASAARMLDTTFDQLAGVPMHQVVHGEHVSRDDCRILQVLDDVQTRTDVVDTFRRKDGTPFPVEFSTSPVHDEGKLVGVVVTFIDVTERRRLESKLEQANRLSSLGRLAATVAHEFNNVLMGISPFVEVIRRARTPERTVTALDQIGHAVTRGKRITSEILRFTQPAEPVRSAIDLGRWLEDMAGEARNLVTPEIAVELIIDQPGMLIDGDVSQLHQMMTNLVLNARDAMPAGGDLTIRAGRMAPGSVVAWGKVDGPERFAHIAVQDTGAGIPPEVIRHVFEPLFTTKKSGTGLGLPLAMQIVQRHGGEIFIETSLGAGTTFHLLLPLAAGVTSGVDESAHVATQAPPPSVRRVLLVEDDRAVATGIASLLEFEGLSVQIVESGAAAIAAVRERRPDVVVLDMGLPDLDGVSVFRELILIQPDLPVVFSTGHGDRSSIEPILARSHVSFLLKPYQAEALLSAIDDVMP